MLSQIDDGELAAAAQGGDRAAFGRLVERHYDLMYRVAYRYLGSAADAEDAAQTVCLALASRLGSFSGRSRFSTWLTSIVINACRDMLRRRKTSQALMERYGLQREFDAADSADTERRADWLQDAMASLEPPLRETVLLVVGEELSHAEVADILGCAETTVSWRMYTVRKRLKARLDNDHEQ